MKKKIISSFFIGGIIATFLELFVIYRQGVFLTHENHYIIIMVITAFFEGALLFSILTWRKKLHFQWSPKSCFLYVSLLIFYYLVRGISVMLSLVISALPSALFGVLISN